MRSGLQTLAWITAACMRTASIVTCLALIALWMRSRSGEDLLWRQSIDTSGSFRFIYIYSGEGVFAVEFQREDRSWLPSDAIKQFSAYLPVWDWQTGQKKFRRRLDFDESSDFALLWHRTDDGTVVTHFKAILLPYWAALSITALPLVVVLQRAARRRMKHLLVRSRLRHGLCAECGYDVRGTPAGERCPECGRVPDLRGC